ncbi:TetR/AcrR family transcriptional regulator [Cohnella rhizosphaerae]|uniref:TetR/AcrR family transcriptional regulator C-terminal domain-containing protein n=1 Tax=Cohnella rhizosphaerae TaxID=1457232 RepID=A0A9X4KRN0_9BACL|nr:TetR/AcrR family transcriptional regulator C-terminal domain-containing protein [Cohnella rhizosphaerae]MDG0809886.1 TetR/AcrR family transcriptional regulator C-terminal domain-containing protein [Cohnella rhizosphaerae]
MEKPAKVDRRILRTRDAITKSFLALVSEKDLDHITINDIADRANVNRGTLYLHYADKYALLDECIKDHIDRMIAVCGAEAVNPIDDLKPMFAYFEANYAFFHTMLSNQKTSVFRDRLLQGIAAGTKAKIGALAARQNMDLELVARFLASAFVGTAEWWILNRMPIPAELAAKQVGELFEKFVR